MPNTKTPRKRKDIELSSFTVNANNIDDILSKIVKKEKEPRFIVIDLFCGAGGTSTGFAMTSGIAEVIACVNHDYHAIKSHWRNHKHVAHFEEDIRTLDLTILSKLLEFYKNLYPNAKVILWASLECTNFSKAKGGQPRDADSRTLADHLDRYVLALNPDYIQIENVVEFMSWGPLDENGKPVSRKNGTDWMRWRNLICSHGYYDEWQEMNAANYGAYTSRNRLFGCFAKHGLPIAWPPATHAKNPNKGIMFDAPLLKWKAVKEVLDFSDEGKSIFNREKQLCDKTLQVIYDGLIKEIKSGQHGFLFKYYGNGTNISPLDVPAGTITTKDRFAKVSVIFRDYKTGFITSIDQPLGTLPTVPKAYLISYILNPSHGGHTMPTNIPSPVIVARQDKAPLYLILAFMNEYGVVDIKMRMLKIPELLLIQGFPKTTVLEGNQSEQKKQIGNSVEPHVVMHWTIALDNRLFPPIKKAA